VLENYISELQGKTSDIGDSGDLLPIYDPSNSTDDDFEKASALKMEGSDLKSAGDYEKAVEKYSAAIVAAPPSALLYANRADCLYRLERYNEAIRDCDEAVKLNPDSAKALRIRGRAKKATENYEGALQDLSASQAIDYDDQAAEDLRFCTEKHNEMLDSSAKERIKKEDSLRKRAEEIKKAREQEEINSTSSGIPDMGGMPGMGGMGMGGMPGMGGMGGMPGVQGLMSSLMSDPELAAGMSNPKIMGAFTKLMSEPGGAMGLLSNPAKVQEIMSDPDVGPFMKKLMSKIAPGMGGMPGMGGGMPSGGDDMPDIDEMPDLSG